MVLPLIITAWILLLGVVVALCRAAALGEEKWHPPEQVFAGSLPAHEREDPHAPVVASGPAVPPSRAPGYARNAVPQTGGVRG